MRYLRSGKRYSLFVGVSKGGACVPEVAFVGGLDLCLGRFDTPGHRLTDDVKPFLFPGMDYSNPNTKDFVDVPAAGLSGYLSLAARWLAT